MVFKLVRTDTAEPCKIQLPAGIHLLGRGKFLDCDDKRVSRNHGELEVTDDSVTIKALHQNPCFYIKKDTKEKQVLKHNCTTNLSNGDKFGLLPDTYWYEVLHCIIPDINRQSPELTEEYDKIDDKAVPSDTESIITNTTIDMNIEITEPAVQKSTDKPENSNSDVDTGNDSEVINSHVDETISRVSRDIASNLNDSPESPSLLTASEQQQSKQDSIDDKPTSCKTEPCSPPKRCHSPDSTDGTKKMKIEPDDDQGQAARPGPSNDQGLSNNDNNKDGQSLQKPNAPPRERCIYGANCYRRNVVHKAQFSHPGDGDWGAGERGACPWGAACRRRDPRHWTAHDHPDGTRPPHDGPRPGKKKKRDSGEVSPSGIVHGKRVRKTVKRDSGWSDSESNSDPFQTDGSDEWEPPSDVTESQDTQNW